MLKKIFITISIILLCCSFNHYVWADDIDDDNIVYEVNLDDSAYISGLEDDIENLEKEISLKDKEISKLEDTIHNLNSDKQNLWLGFIFILLLSIYISYNIGLNKK